jgi:large subunit ribosomal protein L21
MYAVVESGGKQYRVEQGSTLLVDRLAAKEGEKVALKPVMVRDKEALVTPEAVAKVKIEAKVKGHVRGDKIRVFKYKAKKGYSRRSGHRAELTELEILSIGAAPARKAPAKKAQADKPTKATGSKAAPTRKAPAKKSAAKKPAGAKAGTAKKTSSTKAAAGKTTAAKKPAATKGKAKTTKKASADKAGGKEDQDGS